MSRALVVVAAAFTPVWLVLACSAPFTAATDVGAGGSGAAAGAAEVALGASPGEGGTTNDTKPLLSGSAGSGDDVGAAAGSSANVESAGAGGASEITAAAGAAGAAGVTSPPASGTCPALGGEKLVLGAGFCIDENEVTAAHYQAFVDSHPSVLTQPAACLENTSFTNNCKATDPTKQAQRCVDWCDAHAYCASVGKHLCGSATADDGAMPFEAAPAALDNEWYSACSHAGEVAYPYGNAYNASACWGADHPPGAMMVKGAPACVGGYEGLWDMSGGLAEWVDSCNAEKGLADACRIRGGSVSGTADQLRCDWQSATSRSTASNYIGFRCCADLVR